MQEGPRRTAGPVTLSRGPPRAPPHWGGPPNTAPPAPRSGQPAGAPPPRLFARGPRGGGYQRGPGPPGGALHLSAGHLPCTREVGIHPIYRARGDG